MPPRELVFEAWTNPSHLAHWWGPHDFRTLTQSVDVRRGGSWRYLMYGPDGTEYPNLLIYNEIVRPERLVYTHSSGQPDDPGQFQVTVTFEEQEGKTLLTATSVFQSVADRDAMLAAGTQEGADDSMERLAELLARL